MSGPMGSQTASNERGIALISAMLVVLAVAVVAAGFILTASGERAISSNVQIARASLLAADAGVRVSQQVLANQAKAQLDSMTLNWSGSGPLITSPASLFPAGAQSFSSSNPKFSATATVVFADSTLLPNAQSYNYRYTITSTGSSGAQGRREVQSTGILRVSAERGSFADYLCFTDVHLAPGGGPIWFTSSSQFDGRVHTNGQFRFAFQPFFQDLASSGNAKAWFYNNGNPVEIAGNSNGTIDVPLFFGGFERGAAAVPLPGNSFKQQAAALGMTPVGVAPTNTDINNQLGTGAGSSPPPNGIYLVNNGTDVTGGIYVQGNLTQCLVSADTVSNIQTYVLTQGGTSKTIVVDRAASSTSITVGATTTVYFGVPEGVTYVNGSLQDLRGPDRVSGTVPPAIARGTEMLFTATGDVVVQSDLTCDDFADGTNVVGIYTSGGDVVIGPGAPNNMFLDAFVMATGPDGAFRVENYNSGAPRGAFHLRGGVIQRYYGEFFTFDGNGNVDSGYWRDFHYDRRGLIPPFFPTTNRFVANQPSARTLAWKEI
ncbi:MAG: DUF4900 domain-containing protein [Candidatus Eisenbacteria bacterium]